MTRGGADGRSAIVVMAKRPTPGGAKTRLVPPLSANEAAELAGCFLLDALDLVRRSPATPLVAVWPPEEVDYFASVAPDVDRIPQRGDSLDERLAGVMETCLARGFDRVLAINADSPTLPLQRLTAALAALDRPEIDVVLGPATDGGYYLIGCRQPVSEIMRGVTMSTPNVLADTLARAERVGLTVELLEPWYDVDEPADLDRLRADLDTTTDAAADRSGSPAHHTAAFLQTAAVADRLQGSTPGGPSPGGPLVGVVAVIPALNEAETVAEVVKAIHHAGVDSVVVVDNGSTDATAEAAETAGAVVVSETRRGYGYACAAGARAAAELGGDIVVFLDADHSSRPDQLVDVVAPVRAGSADLVLGSRVQGGIEPGSMLAHQRVGNRLCAAVMSWLHDVKVTDLGPFRAIRVDLLADLDMTEMTFGWPTEMTVKAVRRGATVIEVPVVWQRRRGGRSKVSGTLRGSVLAAYHIVRVTVAGRTYRDQRRTGS